MDRLRCSSNYVKCFTFKHYSKSVRWLLISFRTDVCRAQAAQSNWPDWSTNLGNSTLEFAVIVPTMLFNYIFMKSHTQYPYYLIRLNLKK